MTSQEILKQAMDKVNDLVLLTGEGVIDEEKPALLSLLAQLQVKLAKKNKRMANQQKLIGRLAEALKGVKRVWGNKFYPDFMNTVLADYEKLKVKK